MRRALRWLLVGAMAIVVAFLLGTFVPRPLLPVEEVGVGRRVLLLSNPIHTDIAVPIDAEILARFDPLAKAGIALDHLGAHYLVFGWGGRSFYLETPTWSELKPGPVFAALTVDRSVMHVDLAGDIPDPHPDVTVLELGDDGYKRLLDFIEASFQQAAGRPIIIPDAGYGDYDAFFEAHGSFNALLGCNTWTAAALRAAGLRTGWWNPLPQTLEVSLDLYN